MPPLTLEDWRNTATIASAVVSLVALFRPELQRLFARFSGTLLIYPVSERMEIGFSGAGATVGLELNIRARSRDFFVRDANMAIVRLKDNARYSLSWGALRPPVLIGSVQSATFEVPAGFVLEPKVPRRLNIAFQDLVVRDEIMDTLISLREKWWETLRKEGLFPPPVATEESSNFRATIDGLYDQFSQEEPFITAWTTLQRKCYWQPGEYLATVKFSTTEPEQVFEFRRTFSLSREESDRLHANAIPMLRQNVGLTDVPLFFAHPKAQVSPNARRNRLVRGEKGV